MVRSGGRMNRIDAYGFAIAIVALVIIDGTVWSIATLL
jgi:hypothetical protein